MLHILINIPFLNENKGTQILKDLTNSIENQWYSIEDIWNYNCILRELKILQKLVLYDYLICGSFIIYSDNHIKWELQTSILSTINKNYKKNRFTKIRKLLYKAQK